MNSDRKSSTSKVRRLIFAVFLFTVDREDNGVELTAINGSLLQTNAIHNSLIFEVKKPVQGKKSIIAPVGARIVSER
ncbi:hypothetical protein AB1L05_17365 [Cytobacillus horneckiae]|uniref:hypothetical protein n=1 Tax=Cytobacillus horneckiae TaxID=549687 RepID=UPI0039A1ECCF